MTKRMRQKFLRVRFEMIDLKKTVRDLGNERLQLFFRAENGPQLLAIQKRKIESVEGEIAAALAGEFAAQRMVVRNASCIVHDGLAVEHRMREQAIRAFVQGRAKLAPRVSVLP